MNEESDFKWEEEIKKSEQKNKEFLKKLEEVRTYQGPIIHFIYTLNFKEGSFLNLENLKGWLNFVKLILSMFYQPKSYFRFDLKAISAVDNEEIFLLPKIIHEYPDKIGRCKFEELEFDVWTNGIDFEIVLDENVSGKIEFEQLPEIFGRWTSHILLDSLKLISELDSDFEKSISAGLEKNIYDQIVDLEYLSFIIITYPNTKEWKDNVEKLVGYNKITEKTWINDGAAFFYPPFRECIVNLLGHTYHDIDSAEVDVLSALINHLKYWAMFQTLDNFAGLIPNIKYIKVKAEVKKIDFIKSLIENRIINKLIDCKIKHTNMDYLDEIRRRLDRFLNFGLGEKYRGFEYYESDAHLNRKIIGEYFRMFDRGQMIEGERVIFCGIYIELTKKIFFSNFKEDIDAKLKEELKELNNGLEKRIKEALAAINELENNYYRSYELGLNLKAQELTLIGIFIVVFQLLATPIYDFMSYIFDTLSKIIGDFLF